MAIRVSNITVIDDSRNIVNVGNIGIGTTGSSGTLQIGAGTSAFVVTGIGSVGIGITNPGAKLNVVDNSSSDALRITQTGSGNALVVEDETSPDATPFVVTGVGSVGIGTTNPTVKLYVYDTSSTNLRTSQIVRIDSNITISRALDIDHSPSYTTAGIQTSYAQTDYSQTSISVSAGATNNGYVLGKFTGNWRGRAANDAGTLTTLYGNLTNVGHFNSGTPGLRPTTTNVIAHAITGYAYTGSITNLYQLYVDTAIISGYAATNNYGIYCNIDTADATNSAYNLYVPGSAKNYFAGSVGIGTTNPTAKLEPVDAAATPSAAPVIFIQRPNNVTPASNAPTNADLRIKSHSSNFKIYAEDQNANPLMILTGSGNLGIGTTNPTVALQLSPTASISNVGTGITLPGTVGSALTVAQFFYNNANASYLRIKATRNSTGSDWLSASTKLVQVTDVTEQGYIEFNPNGAIYGMAFGGNNGSGTNVEWARFLPSGNLGIGTTNPQAKLDVIGTQRITASSYPTATYGTGVGRIQFGYQDAFDGAELSAGTTMGAGKPLFLNATGSGAVLINSFTSTGTASQTLQVSGGAYVSGNLGVGVTNPGAKLVVDGDVRLAGLDAEIEFNTGGARLKGRSNALSIHTGGGLDTETSEQVRINTTGVGIGTTNPTAKLNVVDNSSSDALRITQLGSGNALVVEDSANPDATPFVVGAAGSVGIGTTNPTTLLDVYGNISVGDNTTNNGAVFRENTNAGLILLGGSTGGANIELYGSTHASVADRAYYDALNHNFRNAGATTTYVAFSTSNSTFNNTVIVANAGIASDGNSQIYLNGATSNRIDFNANGIAAPTTVGTSGTTRSAGTKIVLFPTTTHDYAFGVESGHQWSSIPLSATGWKWYGGAVGVATLGVAGGLTLSGGLTVGTNSNIVGDFTNATLTARTYFITKTTNSFTVVGAIPNGISTTSAFLAFNNSTPTNASYCGPVIDSTAAYLRSDRTGTGAYLPLYLQTTDTTRVAITTTGNVGIGITNPGSSLQVAGPSAGIRITNNTGLVGNLSSTGWLISQASGISAIPPASALTISNGSVTALTLDGGNVGINTTDAGAALDVQGNIRIRDTAGSATFTSGGNLAIKDDSSDPFISFHEAAGVRNAYIQSSDTSGFFVVQEDALPLVLKTELTQPVQFETADIRRVAISTGGETEFLKGISVVAGIATIPTVSVTATTASTTTTTGALTVAGGVGIAASAHVGGDVDYRRSAATVVTATYTGTPANIAAISAVGNVGVVTFATTGIAATMNVTGMLPGQVLELFVTNPTTAKVLTIQYNGTAIAGVGIASASPAQGASFAANGTRLYRFIAATNNPAVVAGDIKVVGTT